MEYWRIAGVLVPLAFNTQAFVQGINKCKNPDGTVTYTTEVCGGNATSSSVKIIDNSMDSKEARQALDSQKARAAAEEAQASQRSARAARDAQAPKDVGAHANVSKAACDAARKKRDFALGQADCRQAGFCEALRSKHDLEVARACG